MKVLKSIPVLVVWVLCFYLGGCNTTSEKATNEGTYKIVINNPENISGKLFLRRVLGNNLVLTDSIQLGSEKQQLLQGKLPETGLYVLSAGDGITYLMLVDPDSIRLTLTSNGFESVGSAAHNDFVALIKLQKKYENSLDSLNQAYILASNMGKTEQVLRLEAEFNTVKKRTASLLKQWIFEHTPGVATVYAASFFNPEEEMSFIDSVLTHLQSVNLQSEMVKTYVESIQKLKNTNIGSFAPDFTQATHNGKTITLSQLKGNVVLLDFWASWCGPCRKSNPELVELYKEFKDKNFKILSVSLDEDVSKWKSAIADDGLLWDTHVSDLKGWDNAAAQLYRVEEIPQTYLIDATGKIIAKNLKGERLKAVVSEQLSLLNKSAKN